MGKRTAKLLWKIAKNVLDIVWKTAAVYGTVLGLTTGTIGLVEEFAPESPVRPVIEMPEVINDWLLTTGQAAQKYLEAD